MAHIRVKLRASNRFRVTARFLFPEGPFDGIARRRDSRQRCVHDSIESLMADEAVCYSAFGTRDRGFAHGGGGTRSERNV